MALVTGGVSADELSRSQAEHVKILHVLNELQPSGAETMLRLAAEPWQARGLELEILSVGQEVGSYAATLAAAGFRVHHIPLGPVGTFLRRYAGLLRAGRYHVVHVHPERANFVLAAIARILGRAGVVRTVHNVFAFEGRLRLERRLQRAALRRLGVVHVGIGESVAASEIERFSNPTQRISNAFDETRFRPPTPEDRAVARAALGLAPEEFVIAVVGNCSHVKNHRALIEAMSLPEAPEARLLHVGLEDEQATGERTLTEELGLAERVRFLGFVDEVPRVLHAADAYVMPSKYEGLSIAALETLGCGVPSVLADVPGLCDFRTHIPNLWWVEPRAGSIAPALAEVADMDPEERRAWSEETATRVRHEFGIERHVRAYHRLYLSVARSRPAS